MEASDMDLHLMQSFIEEFINVYGEQFDELVDCISKIKELDDGILKMHWSGEGKNAFKTKINEWADSLKDVKTEMKTTKKAVTRLDEDTDILIGLAESIIIAGR